MSLDTLSIARELREADLAPEHAEAIASAIGRAVNEGAATKADIEKLIVRFDSNEAKTASQLDALEQRLVAKLEGMRSSLLVWLVGTTMAAAGLLITIGKVFFQ
jgi:hypothetical protein